MLDFQGRNQVFEDGVIAASLRLGDRREREQFMIVVEEIVGGQALMRGEEMRSREQVGVLMPESIAVF